MDANNDDPGFLPIPRQRIFSVPGSSRSRWCRSEPIPRRLKMRLWPLRSRLLETFRARMISPVSPAFSKLTQNRPWNVALLTNLGLEYYNTGHYSKTLEVWRQAWELGRAATDLKGKAIADRAVGELAYMHARLGQMTELTQLLKSVEGRAFSGPATERITGAREGLWNMENRPEIAFRCGPLLCTGSSSPSIQRTPEPS